MKLLLLEHPSLGNVSSKSKVHREQKQSSILSVPEISFFYKLLTLDQNVGSIHWYLEYWQIFKSSYPNKYHLLIRQWICYQKPFNTSCNSLKSILRQLWDEKGNGESKSKLSWKWIFCLRNDQNDSKTI